MHWKILLLIPVFLNLTIQAITQPVFKLDPDECYLVARGTRSKQSFISERFNIINDSITHIGIGITVDSGFRIFNINPVRSGNALLIEDMESYLDEPDLVYAGIWKLELTKREKTFLKDSLSRWVTQVVDFDNEFMIDDDLQKLYCSEFCWRITNMLGPGFWSSPGEVNTFSLGLDGLLKRDLLVYIPTDYFLKFKRVKYIGSWNDQNFKF